MKSGTPNDSTSVAWVASDTITSTGFWTKTEDKNYLQY